MHAMSYRGCWLYVLCVQIEFRFVQHHLLLVTWGPSKLSYSPLILKVNSLLSSYYRVLLYCRMLQIIYEFFVIFQLIE